jgi:hypothetical protein
MDDTNYTNLNPLKEFQTANHVKYAFVALPDQSAKGWRSPRRWRE